MCRFFFDACRFINPLSLACEGFYNLVILLCAGVRFLRRVSAQVRERQRLEVLYRPLRLPAPHSSRGQPGKYVICGEGGEGDCKSYLEVTEKQLMSGRFV